MILSVVFVPFHLTMANTYLRSESDHLPIWVLPSFFHNEENSNTPIFQSVYHNGSETKLIGIFITVQRGDNMQAPAQQLECVRRSDAGDDLVVNAGPGAGKGLRSDQPVITPKGYVAIGKLKYGDLVYGSDGNAYPVLGIYHRGILPLYIVKFNDGQSVITDGDHRWLCKTLSERKKSRPAVVRTTSELIDLNKNVF